MIKTTRTFHFSSAHHLPNYPGDCKNLHGHTWKLEVTVFSSLYDDGISIDFKQLKKYINEQVIDVLDHRVLNDVIPMPTAENLGLWIFHILSAEFDVFEVRLWESQDCYITIDKEAFYEYGQRNNIVSSAARRIPLGS